VDSIREGRAVNSNRAFYRRPGPFARMRNPD
jgi:hypothetical protein